MSSKSSKKQSKKQGTTKSSAKASAKGSSSKGSSKGSSKASSATGTANTTTATSGTSKANSKALKNPSAKGGSKKAAAAAATTTKKFNFGVNAESGSEGTTAVDPSVVEQNDEQLRMIVGLLEGVSMDFVTQHIKEDLDRIQKLVLNIAYREADERKKVVSVHFTEAQRVVIKTVCCDGVGAGGGPLPTPPLSYPFVKLKLAATRPSVDGGKQKKKQQTTSEKTKKKKG